VDTGLTTFDLSVTSVINEIKEEGTKIKAKRFETHDF
jgi:hypothetical protein